MDRRLVGALALALLVAIATVAATAASGPRVAAPLPPPAVTLDAGWTYVADPGDTGIAQGLFTGAGTGWAPIAVPDVMNPGLTRAQYKGSIGWYRYTLTPPPAAPGQRWALHFGQVRRTATIWLNGAVIATHDDPYGPFTVPLRKLIPDQPNVLVLRVDGRRAPGISEGWWNWGGVTEPVTLVPQGGVVLRDPALMSRLRCDAHGDCTHATVVFDATIRNDTPAPVTPHIAVMLRPPSGGTNTTLSAFAIAPVPPGATHHIRATIPVAGRPMLWAPGTPRLYDATITTSVDGAVQEVDTTLVGLRSIVAHNGVLLLNGRPVQLRGASIEQDVPKTGAALSAAQIATLIGELHAVHANVTRAQYLLDDRLLTALDRAGILVWEQAPVFSRDGRLHTPAQRRTALTQVRHTILADRGHPSVLTTSVANELSPTPDRDPGVRMYLVKARRLVRLLDPTRPPAVDLLGWPGYPYSHAYGGFPLIGVDCYFGWYPGPSGHHTANFASLAPFLERTHRQYRRSALVMTEFGAESTRNGPLTERGTYAFQADYVRRVLRVVGDDTFMNGAIYWTLREFAVKPGWNGGGVPRAQRDGLHHKGLISYRGRRKPAFAAAAKLFAATPLFRPATTTSRPRR